MSAEFKVRHYYEGDEEGIVDLLQIVWCGWPHLDVRCSPIEHWRWKYKANPLPLRFIVVVESAGKIVGCGHAIPIRIKAGSDTLICSTGADLAVHPDFRKLGISDKIGELADSMRREAGVNLDYHITGNPILIKSFEKRRMRFPFEISNLVRIRDIGKHLKNMPVDNEPIIRIGYSTLKMLGDARKLFRIRSGHIDSINIVETDRFDERINEFWDGVKDTYNYIVERRCDYLNWKYCDPREGKFDIRLAKVGGRIAGYSVLRVNRYTKDYPIGYLVDLLALPGRTDVAEQLANNAINFFDESDINTVIYQVVKGHPYEEVLRAQGFLSSRIRLHMFYKQLEMPPKLNELKGKAADRIYVSWGDHDVLPVSIPRY